MEEEEEEEEEAPLTFDEVERMVAGSSDVLHARTGAYLPRLTLTPMQAARHVEHVSLGIELPLGSLFYPCCGSDTEHAMTSFGRYVTACHFADPYNPPCEPTRGRSRRSIDRRRALEEILVPDVGTVVVGGRVRRQVDNGACLVHVHEKDGLLALIEDVPFLSVFYYRRDSGGEGGSGQWWLGPVLFHTLLARLLDGGIIATSGPNCGSGRRGRSAPWAALCASSKDESPFVYAGRAFRFVGELKAPRSEDVRLWRVASEPPQGQAKLLQS